MAVEGARAYVVYGRTGLVEILDVTDPSRPRAVGSYQAAGRPQQVAVDKSRLAVPLGRSGVVVIDVSDPSSPTPVASYDTPGSARAVAMRDDLVVVADGNGLVLLRIPH